MMTRYKCNKSRTIYQARLCYRFPLRWMWMAGWSWPDNSVDTGMPRRTKKWAGEEELECTLHHNIVMGCCVWWMNATIPRKRDVLFSCRPGRLCGRSSSIARSYLIGTGGDHLYVNRRSVSPSLFLYLFYFYTNCNVLFAQDHLTAEEVWKGIQFNPVGYNFVYNYLLTYRLSLKVSEVPWGEVLN